MITFSRILGRAAFNKIGQLLFWSPVLPEIYYDVDFFDDVCWFGRAFLMDNNL